MNHLSPEVLAGYLDDALPAEERRQAELHLASCGECRLELAEVRALEPRHTGIRAPSWLNSDVRMSRPVLISLAAAAALLLVVAIPRDTPTPSTVRSGSRTNPLLEIVSPLPSEPVVPPVTFVWRNAGPGASYSLTLQREDGRLAWTSSTADTSIAVPDSLELGSGRTWFWYVDALLPDGQALSTGVQRLRTSP